MSEIVLILGAGASKHAGGPLMSDFLAKARAFHKNNQGDQYRDDFDQVFAAIGKLQQVHSKSDLDLGNLEEVFGAFEMARMIGRFPGLADQDVDRLFESFKRVIVRTLELQIRFRVSEQGGLLPTERYGELADVIGRLNSNRVRPRCSVITFNYDIALDHALQFAGVPIDYGLNASVAGGTPLLKLHGSINWAKVRGQDEIFPWDLRGYTSRRGWVDNPDSPYGILGIGTEIANGGPTPSGKATERVPVIMPPTWNKTNYYPSVAKVWQRAASELGGAEYIFVSGYSLTGTDTYFKYLFSIGSTSDQILQRFEVFDPGDVEEKFKHYATDFLSLVQTLGEFAPKRVQQ